MTQGPIKTAILGFGRSGSSLHANPLDANDAFTVTAVCDIDQSRLDQAKARFGCALYTDYHRMLQEADIDFVVVVTRSSDHCRMALECLEAGKHVLVTKPWAVDAREAETLTDASKRSKGKLLPWLPARWACDFVRLQQVVSARTIGNIFIVRRTITSFATRVDWQTLKEYGGGYLLNWGPHIVDPPVLLLTGRVASVFAQLRQVVNPGDTEDVFLGILTLEDGSIVQVEYTIAAEPLPGWYIQGTEGTISVRDRHMVCRRKKPTRPADPTAVPSPSSSGSTDRGGDRVAEEDIEGNLYGDEHEIYTHVAGELTGTGTYPVRPEDALELSRVFEAMKLSQAENRVVHMVELRG